MGKREPNLLPFAPRFPPHVSVHQQRLRNFNRHAKSLSSNDELMICVVCGNPANDLHHRDGRLRSPQDVDNPRILYPFCRKCHDLIQFGEWKEGVFHHWTITTDDLLYDNDRLVLDLHTNHIRFIEAWEELNDRNQ